jgi:hypothetical protein
MGWNDQIDLELHDLIEDAVDTGWLEEGTAVYGVAQKVIHDGYKSLSPKQRYVYGTYVVTALEKREEGLESQRIMDTH